MLYIQHNLNLCRMLLEYYIGGGCYALCVYSRNSVCVGCYWNIMLQIGCYALCVYSRNSVCVGCYCNRMLCFVCIQ